MSVKMALIMAGGKAPALPTLAKHLKDADLIIGADLGAEHLLRAGRIPDVVIGDMDSCAKGVIQNIVKAGSKVVEFPAEKDFTDLEAAIDYCIDHGYQQIKVLAALHGRRIDHIFGNVFLLLKYAYKGLEIRLCDDNGRFVQAITDSIQITGKIGSYVSLIPLTSQVQGVKTTGLKYPLNDSVLIQGSSLGISNELVASSAQIAIDNGVLLVIKEIDAIYKR